MSQLFGKYWRHLDIPRHLFHFNKENLTALLEKSGFRVKRVGHEILRGSIISSLCARFDISADFNNTPMNIFYFIMIPFNKLFESLGFGGAIYILAEKG